MTTAAEVIADTQSPYVETARITTFQVYAPRFLLAELNTHRLLSRSAQSSRAIPVKKRIEGVMRDPYIPQFTRNQRGMQGAHMTMEEDMASRREWVLSCENAVHYATNLEARQVHKQHANRILEPYAHFWGVVTATELDNFWKLRISEHAQPEFRELATEMLKAYSASIPKLDVYHLPYIQDDDRGEWPIDCLLGISAARCARVSYLTFDGLRKEPRKDLELARDLMRDLHMSPFDHQGYADRIYQNHTNLGEWRYSNPEDHRQYWGWIPHRVSVERTLGMQCRRSSFATLDPAIVTGTK